jgi:squalene-hopene/tetraprenyl-beta-curcumene cyclase
LRESRAGIDRALSYLVKKQAADGLWCSDPAISSLVITAMMGSGQKEYSVESEPVKRALARLRQFARPDGSIYGKFYPGYTTSICAMAFIEAGRPEDKEILRGARKFLLSAQVDEGEGFKKDDPQYGGWGYEKPAEGQEMHEADMSNTQFALEAVRALQEAAEEDVPGGAAAEGRTETELCFQKAITYLERCQNKDGGFVYRPDESKAGEAPEGGLRSYGSMTYAGLKSMVYARLDPNDKRVRAAREWACKHWSVTENPGLGDQGVYYYYLTMAKALSVWGGEALVDAAGKKHNWHSEMTAQLLKIQQADGSWVNKNARWMENIPELSTAFTVLGIEHALEGSEKR